MAKKILVVDDEPVLTDTLRYNLVKEGYTVSVAANGETALNLARQEKPDLVILDVMLPVLDGFEVCRILRQETTVPILMLTAKDEEIDKVVGLELGADDYMAKPFSMRELLARVRALLRRVDMLREEQATRVSNAALIRVGDLTIDLARRTVFLRDDLLELKLREFELLAFLAQNEGIVFTRETLLERVWGYDFPGDTRTVDVHVRWLREKIEPEPGNPRHLLTVRGVGYRFQE